MSKVVGIDLGTTNSVIAAIEGGQPIVIANAEGFRTTPSIVAYTKNKELLVGPVAKRQSILNPPNTFYSTKRLIGSKEEDISKNLKKLPYPIVSDKNGNIKIKCSALDKEFSPQEIAAQILRKLVNDAETYFGQKITQAVVTVPAYFNESQRQATIDAGKIAGLEILRIVNEPTAASLAYGLDKKNNETILVFDLGGGTFDVSILDVGDGVFEVVSTTGDTNLGGDDFDKLLVNWILEDFKKRENIDLTSDPQALQRLTEASEKAKIELSTALKTKIYLPFITSSTTGPKHIDVELTREIFENLCKDLVDRCRFPVEQALIDAKRDKSKINQVVLVGGSTRMPMVRELVKSLLDKELSESVNPDEVVAIGAAIQAGIIVGEINDILLLDVTPLSLGIETLGDLTVKMISRNTILPAKKSNVFSTSTDNQPYVDIHVLQGERELASANKSLGIFILDGIPPAPRGVPQIEVTFDIDVDGLLSVTAKEFKTQKEQTIVIQDTSNLDSAEIQKMIKDAEKYAEADSNERYKIDLKNQAELVIEETSKYLKNNENELKPEEKNYLDSLLKSISTSLKSENYPELEQLLNDIKKVSSDYDKNEVDRFLSRTWDQGPNDS